MPEIAPSFRSWNDAPLVSVVIPCYAQAEYLSAAVESVVAQTYSFWQVLIVDDGSPDDSAEVAERLIFKHGDRISLLRQQNAGLAAARNAGIRAAGGRLILPLDADDAIAPTMLEKTVAMIIAGADVVHTETALFGERTGRWPAIPVHRSALSWRNRLPYCSLYRKVLWEKVAGYRSDMHWGYEDWDFWLACAELGAIFDPVHEPLFRYRVRSGSMITLANANRAVLTARLRAHHPRAFTPQRRALGLAAWLLPATQRRIPIVGQS